MSLTHQYIAAIGCFQGILLFAMLVFDTRVTSANKLLGFTCLLLGSLFLLQFVLNGLAPPVLTPLAVWMFFLPVMFGPLVYLYCRTSILGSQLRISDAVHITPLLICYLLNLDTLIFAADGIRAWIVGANAPTIRIWFSEYLIFAIAVSYLGAAMGLLYRYQKTAADSLSNFDPLVFKWLWVLVLCTLVIWVGKAIMALTNIATSLMIVFSDFLIVLFIYLIALAQWRNPMLFTIARLSEVEDEKSRERATSLAQTGVLEAEDRATLYESVQTQVERQKLYKDPDITLNGLAETLGMSRHHLSEVLNQHAGKNFNQFINAYRVADVCERLQEGRAGSILDIALEAGFSSKSTFNTLFKKCTGSTPSQYRQALQR